MVELLTADDLPAWFVFPTGFISVVNQGLTDFHPWHVLRRGEALTRMTGLAKRFPALEVVPFAVRTDSEFVACFTKNDPGVSVLKDFAQPRVLIRQYGSIQDWFRAAIEDCLTFEPEGSIWAPSGALIR